MDLNQYLGLLSLGALILLRGATCNEDAKKLYGNILQKSGYNKNIRPVKNATECVQISIGLKVAQILDVVCIYYFVIFFILYQTYSISQIIGSKCPKGLKVYIYSVFCMGRKKQVLNITRCNVKGLEN